MLHYVIKRRVYYIQVELPGFCVYNIVVHNIITIQYARSCACTDITEIKGKLRWDDYYYFNELSLSHSHFLRARSTTPSSHLQSEYRYVYVPNLLYIARCTSPLYSDYRCYLLRTSFHFHWFLQYKSNNDYNSIVVITPMFL